MIWTVNLNIHVLVQRNKYLMSQVKSFSIQATKRQNMSKTHQSALGLLAQTGIRAGEAIYLNRKSLEDVCSKVKDSSQDGKT